MSRLSQPLALDDDVGTVYLARMDPDAGKNNSTQQPVEETGQPILPVQPVPPLPERNARRSSQFLSALVISAAAASETVGGQSIKSEQEPETQTQTCQPLPTPHDMYLSSEEDASSAGDLSDSDSYYEELDEYDLSPGLPATAAAAAPMAARRSVSGSPPRRHSHDTARVVSVVFSGKPSLVDVALEREARRQTGLLEPTSLSELSCSTSRSSHSGSTRPSTTSSDSASTRSTRSTRTSTLSASYASPPRAIHSNRASTGLLLPFSERRMALQKNPDKVRPAWLQLHIDPSAAATCSPTSAPQPQSAHALEHPPLRYATPAFTPPTRSTTTAPTTASNTPRTPTSSLLRGVTRTLTLNRRRSRPLLSHDSSFFTAPLREPTPAPHAPTPAPAPALAPLRTTTPAPPLSAPLAPAPVPQSPVTYNDIVRSARRKSLATASLLQTASQAPAPTMVPERTSTPIFGKRSSSGGGGLFGNLAARRRSRIVR